VRSEYGERREKGSPWGIAAATVTACGAVMFMVVTFSEGSRAPILEASVAAPDPIVIIELDGAPEVTAVE
jgi:hypothetical protein